MAEGSCNTKTKERYWMRRSSHGRKPIFETPADLKQACYEYLEWVEENPLFEMKAFNYQGVVTQEPVMKMRAMTKQGLCIFLDIALSTWDNYREKEDFLGVISEIEAIIYDQKFSGAAADLLNANIIARDLGLTDKKEGTLSAPGGGPVETKWTIEFVNAETSSK